MFFQREQDDKYEITCNRDIDCEWKDITTKDFGEALIKQRTHDASHEAKPRRWGRK
ncbi:hypothetical protein ACFQ61_02345 [Streptomyces sp. NPDC056500]|uniref:hypothetical protein n=1 Tax=Streptomyces sp. NPDC056500 TaxID=3345840 RepID=UPI0036A3691E